MFSFGLYDQTDKVPIHSLLVSIYVAGLLLVVGGVQEVMRQIDFGVKLYLLLHVAVAISN
jgi:uncharacterized membrane protein HdeD (DUF308 family)